MKKKKTDIYQENCIRDNRGVTLLEIIIAVTIFAIAALVIFKGFYSAGMMNKKSNTNMNATSAAQNIMEGVKTSSAEKLALQFNYPWDVRKDECRFNVFPVTSETAMEIKNKTIQTLEVNKSGIIKPGDSSISSSDNGTTYKFLPKENGQYYFQIRNMKSGNERFDATVTLDGMNAKTEDDGSARDFIYKDSNPASKKPNNYEAPNLADLNVYEDAFLVVGDYTTKDSMDQMAFQHMIENYKAQNPESGNTPEVFTVAQVAPYAKRYLEIEVKTEHGSKKAVAKYTVTVEEMQNTDGMTINEKKYKCTGNNENDKKHDGNGKCFCTNYSENIFFDNSETGSPLRGVYLFYCPNYNSKDENKPLDEIRFVNKENIDLELFVVKQRANESIAANLQASERAYRMRMTIDETPKAGWNTLASKYRGATKFRTNLNMNIGYNTLAERENDKSAVKQMWLRYNDTFYGNSRYVDNKTSADKSAVYAITHMKNLQASESKYRIFSIKVNVYKEGTLAKDQSEWKKELIVTLDGAKND